MSVNLAYVADRFRVLVDSDLYLPEAWAKDKERRKEAAAPDELEYRSKLEIAIDLLKRSIANGMAFTSR